MAAKTDAEAVILRDALAIKAGKGMTNEEVVEEYLDQLAILGLIQTQKMDACKALFKCVWAFCATMLLLGAISLLCHMDIPFHVHKAATCTHEQTVTRHKIQAVVSDRPSINAK